MTMSRRVRKEALKSFAPMTIKQLEAIVRNMDARAAKAQALSALASSEIQRRLQEAAPNV